MLGKGIGRHRLYRYQSNDRPPRRVCYGLKDVSSHDLNQHYAMKRLRMQAQPNDFAKALAAFLQELKVRSRYGVGRLRRFIGFSSRHRLTNAERDSPRRL